MSHFRMLPVAMLLLAGVCGCRPPAGAKAEVPVDDSSVVDAGTHLAEMAEHSSHLTAILKQVTDEASARRAITEMDRLNQENLSGARYVRAIQLGKVGGPDYASQEAKWLAAQSAFKAELDRVKSQDPAAYRALIPYLLEE